MTPPYGQKFKRLCMKVPSRLYPDKGIFYLRGFYETDAPDPFGWVSKRYPTCWVEVELLTSPEEGQRYSVWWDDEAGRIGFIHYGDERYVDFYLEETGRKGKGTYVPCRIKELQDEVQD